MTPSKARSVMHKGVHTRLINRLHRLAEAQGAVEQYRSELIRDNSPAPLRLTVVNSIGRALQSEIVATRKALKGAKLAAIGPTITAGESKQC